MKKASLGLPSGFRDLLGGETRKRRTIENTLAGIFELKGYTEVRPSAVEYFDVYTRGKQSVRDRVFRFLDRDDNLLALRADFTPSIARIVTSRGSTLTLPARAWYAGSVFRKSNSRRGLPQELWQVGAELIGVNSVEHDAEILDLMLECLKALRLGNLQLHLSHAGVFRGIAGQLRLDREGRQAVTSEIDRKDSRGLASRLRTLGVAPDVQAQIHALTGCVGDRDALSRARDTITNEESRRAIDALLALGSGLDRWHGDLLYDLTEVDEMEYYTGVMFTIFSPRLRSELGKGGRYDALLGDFGKDLPAVGFSLSLDGLAELA